ncbi:Fic family protein [Streptomyces sp. NPDC093982]|uniref:type II toxin-antitoxin system death-on-curing family toxin n=1 Tax=Streptomyces sp. NPDC093982 TaxID=3155077 RepID=UPI0034340AC2
MASPRGLGPSFTALAEHAFDSGRPRRGSPGCSRRRCTGPYPHVRYLGLRRPPRAGRSTAACHRHNHPFVDGNKRTAWLATATFLALNGVDLTGVDLTGVDQGVAYALVIDVASGDEEDIAVIAGRLRRL